ncbi:SLC9A8, partial [Symbiodinium microadriaticum]
MLSAWVFKVVDLSKHRLLLVSLFVGMVYIPFLLSESLQLSGILTILFSAITARRYINHNIPPEAQRASAFVFELIAYLAETSVFLYLGFDVFSSNVTWGFRLSLILWTIVLCLISRAVVVYPILGVANHYRAKMSQLKGKEDANLIPMNMIHMVFFSGLRGAVAYASANIYPENERSSHRSEIVATTTCVVLATLFVNGGLTVQMCEWLAIETGVDVAAMTAKMRKIETSAFLIWEHKYIYPLVIKGYNDPNFSDPYKPKSD